MVAGHIPRQITASEHIRQQQITQLCDQVALLTLQQTPAFSGTSSSSRRQSLTLLKDGHQQLRTFHNDRKRRVSLSFSLTQPAQQLQFEGTPRPRSRSRENLPTQPASQHVTFEDKEAIVALAQETWEKCWYTGNWETIQRPTPNATQQLDATAQSTSVLSDIAPSPLSASASVKESIEQCLAFIKNPEVTCLNIANNTGLLDSLRCLALNASTLIKLEATLNGFNDLNEAERSLFKHTEEYIKSLGNHIDEKISTLTLFTKPSNKKTLKMIGKNSNDLISRYQDTAKTQQENNGLYLAFLKKTVAQYIQLSESINLHIKNLNDPDLQERASIKESLLEDLEAAYENQLALEKERANLMTRREALRIEESDLRASTPKQFHENIDHLKDLEAS